MMTPQQIAAKWARNAAAAGPMITQAVQQMQEADNPMVKAAAKEAEWLAGCQRAAQRHAFAEGLSKVTLADWKRAMLTKGVQNYQNGIQGGQAKMERFLGNFLPWVEAGRQNLPARGTLEQNIARMSQMVRHLSAFRGGGGAGFGGFGGMPGT